MYTYAAGSQGTYGQATTVTQPGAASILAQVIGEVGKSGPKPTHYKVGQDYRFNQPRRLLLRSPPGAPCGKVRS